MKNSKLLQLVASFKADEIHWFQKFLQSPFYNTSKTPILLFAYIHKYYPKLNSPKLNKEAAFKKLFPNEKFKAQKLRKAMYELAHLAESFLLTMHLREEKYQSRKLLTAELAKRNTYPLFKKRTEGLINENYSLAYRDANYYKEIHELKLGLYEHVETKKEKKNMSTLAELTTHFDSYYLAQRQRLEYTIKTHEKLMGSKFSLPSLEQTQANLEKESVFKLYTLINQALTTSNNDNIYLEIEDLFKKDVTKLGRIDQLEIIRVILNHFAYQINHGNKTYYQKMLSMYKFGLKQNLILKEGQIGENTFTNIASIGIGVGDFNWVLNFIKTYKEYLADSIREKTSSLSLGLLYFYKEEYEKTIRIILNQSFEGPLHILTSKTLLLRTYFEQFLLDNSFYDLVLDQAQAFEKFLHRNNLISDEKKEMYINFSRFLKKMTHAKMKNSLNKSFYKKIESTDAIILKSWLLKKIETLSS